jgi:hypothetical protein
VTLTVSALLIGVAHEQKGSSGWLKNRTRFRVSNVVSCKYLEVLRTAVLMHIASPEAALLRPKTWAGLFVN